MLLLLLLLPLPLPLLPLPVLSFRSFHQLPVPAFMLPRCMPGHSKR